MGSEPGDRIFLLAQNLEMDIPLGSEHGIDIPLGSKPGDGYIPFDSKPEDKYIPFGSKPRDICFGSW